MTPISLPSLASAIASCEALRGRIPPDDVQEVIRLTLESLEHEIRHGNVSGVLDLIHSQRSPTMLRLTEPDEPGTLNEVEP